MEDYITTYVTEVSYEMNRSGLRAGSISKFVIGRVQTSDSLTRVLIN